MVKATCIHTGAKKQQVIIRFGHSNVTRPIFFKTTKNNFSETVMFIPPPQLANHHGQRHHTETPQTKIKNLTQDLKGISFKLPH